MDEKEALVSQPVKLIALLKAAPGMSREQFSRRWIEGHAPFALRFPNLKGYRINVAVDEYQAMEGELPYDGTAELWWDSLEEMQEAFDSPGRPLLFASGSIPSTADGQRGVDRRGVLEHALIVHLDQAAAAKGCARHFPPGPECEDLAIISHHGMVDIHEIAIWPMAHLPDQLGESVEIVREPVLADLSLSGIMVDIAVSESANDCGRLAPSPAFLETFQMRIASHVRLLLCRTRPPPTISVNRLSIRTCPLFRTELLKKASDGTIDFLWMGKQG
jgi:uncharacterized protein (TIGR02118 family)